MTDDKTIRWNRLMQDLRDRSGLPLVEVERDLANNPMARSTFEVMYQQVQSFNERADTAEKAEAAARQRADLASMKAQTFFVRLRDAGLLKEGESY